MTTAYKYWTLKIIVNADQIDRESFHTHAYDAYM